MVRNISALTRKEEQLNMQATIASKDNFHLLKYMPTKQEWQQATDSVTASNRGQNNPEIVALDALLLEFHKYDLKNGKVPDYLPAIIDKIDDWYNRRNDPNSSSRWAAMTTLRSIANKLMSEVAFYSDDSNRHWSTLQNKMAWNGATGLDIIPGGFSELGPTAESVRQGVALKILKDNGYLARFNTYNEALSELSSYGLLPGPQFAGGGSCHDAPGQTISKVKNKLVPFYGRAGQILLTQMKVQRSKDRDHRFLKMDTIAHGRIIIDPSYRQFWPRLCDENTAPVPAIFVGTSADLSALISANHADTVGNDPYDIYEP